MKTVSEQGLCTFRIGAEWFGLPLSSVLELLGHRNVQSVPMSSTQIHGLLNLRGQILTVLDPSFFCEHAPDWEPMLVVFLAGERKLALAVEEIGDVRAVQAANRHDAPPHLNDSLRRICTAAHSVGDSLILELDPLSVSQVRRASARNRSAEERS